MKRRSPLMLLAGLTLADAFFPSSSSSSILKQKSLHRPLYSHKENIGSSNPIERRILLNQALFITTTASSVLPLLTAPKPSYASDDTSENNVSLLKGTVKLQQGLEFPSDEVVSEKTSLYITARPNRPDNVPKAILDGSRGKPPPILVTKIVSVDKNSFPLDFDLSKNDLTVEGGQGSPPSEDGTYWWGKDDLIVSARLDMDGSAYTRDPDDLVGRGYASVSERDSCQIILEGRGITGRLITGKKK